MIHNFKWQPVDKFRIKPISDFVEYTNDCYLNWMLPEREIRRVKRMQRIFISQPMNGLTDEQIKEVRNRTIEYIKAHDDSAIIIDSYIEEEPPKDCNQGIWYLGKSIELLASADMIWMIDGWQNARGCILENEIACQYGLIINYATQEGC